MFKNTWALVVETDPHNLTVISNVLKELGIAYKRNTTGLDVAEYARAMQPKPDFILLSMDLPEADPYAICRQIQADSYLSSIPVIALSDKSAGMLHNQLKAAGFRGFIRKPLPRSDISVLLQGFLQGETDFTDFPTRGDR